LFDIETAGIYDRSLTTVLLGPIRYSYRNALSTKSDGSAWFADGSSRQDLV
jgi:hypothetical protein